MNPAESSGRLASVSISPHVSIKDALAQLDRAGTGALLLCGQDRELLGILTDGDIRRAILNGVPLDSACSLIASHKPIVALTTMTEAEALHLMDHSKEYVINHLPVVDGEGRVAGLLLRSDLMTEDNPTLSAVIMAGGFGTRLLPLTENVPKPMLPVGEHPLLELTIARLRDAGIKRVHVTTHYMAEKITDYFGDGRAFGVEINYVSESRPLGTAGALKLMEARDEPLLVLNGDILTGVNFRDMLAFHRRYRPDVTVGVRRYDMSVPYGIVDCDGPTVRGLREKPVLNFLVNAGIYLLEPTVQHHIPNDQRYDMTDLISRLLEQGRPVASFPIVEYWLDIGQHADYAKAQEDVKLGRVLT